MRVAAGKATGTGAGGDPGMFRDGGAETVLDFTDFGYASTYRLDHEAVVAVFTSLVDELVRSMDTEGALPLLQFALAELWEHRDVEAGTISARALAEMGGVSGALARHADSVVAALPPRLPHPPTLRRSPPPPRLCRASTSPLSASTMPGPGRRIFATRLGSA